MTSVFDGMAGVLNDVFGAPVTIRQSGGVLTSVQAVFRLAPIEVVEDGQAVLITAPTLRIRRDHMAALPEGRLKRGDEVTPSVAAPRRFAVVNQLPGESPAPDGFVVVELEELL